MTLLDKKQLIEEKFEQNKQAMMTRQQEIEQLSQEALRLQGEYRLIVSLLEEEDTYFKDPEEVFGEIPQN